MGEARDRNLDPSTFKRLPTQFEYAHKGFRFDPKKASHVPVIKTMNIGHGQHLARQHLAAVTPLFQGDTPNSRQFVRAHDRRVAAHQVSLQKKADFLAGRTALKARVKAREDARKQRLAPPPIRPW